MQLHMLAEAHVVHFGPSALVKHVHGAGGGGASGVHFIGFPVQSASLSPAPTHWNLSEQSPPSSTRHCSLPVPPAHLHVQPVPAAHGVVLHEPSALLE